MANDRVEKNEATPQPAQTPDERERDSLDRQKEHRTDAPAGTPGSAEGERDPSQQSR
jgi:hypothetical protein